MAVNTAGTASTYDVEVRAMSTPAQRIAKCMERRGRWIRLHWIWGLVVEDMHLENGEGVGSMCSYTPGKLDPAASASGDPRAPFGGRSRVLAAVVEAHGFNELGVFRAAKKNRCCAYVSLFTRGSECER